ncbi:MAG: hypothetical protein HUJ91_05810, partial [Bacteroidales bacterium]|nr:hypothetical protein [Bacteroidales bacterium]
MSIKNIFIYAALAFSAVFLAGCADDLIQGTPEVNDDSQTSSLTISLPAPTKGTFSDDGASAIKLRWALGDMVEVYELYGTDSLTFIATEIYNGGTSAKFEAPAGQTISKYCSAVYPASAGRNSTAWYERIKYVQEQDITNPTANLEEYLVATGMDPDGDGTIEMFPQLSIFKLVANVSGTDFAGKIPESATVWGPWGDQAFKVKFTSATAASGTIAAYIVTKPALPSSSAVPVHAVINGTNSATDNTKGALISYETSKSTQAAISTFVLSAPKSNVGYVQLYAGGPKWAIRNVGAGSATDKGDWFSWGMPNA